MPNSIFFQRRGGDSNLKVSQTQGRRRTKNDPFLNMGFKHGKKWVDKNGAKCNMGFGRITKNTRRQRPRWQISEQGDHRNSRGKFLQRWWTTYQGLLCSWMPKFSRCLRTAPSGSAPGPGGCSNEMLRVCLDDVETLGLLFSAAEEEQTDRNPPVLSCWPP